MNTTMKAGGIIVILVLATVLIASCFTHEEIVIPGIPSLPPLGFPTFESCKWNATAEECYGRCAFGKSCYPTELLTDGSYKCECKIPCENVTDASHCSVGGCDNLKHVCQENSAGTGCICGRATSQDCSDICRASDWDMGFLQPVGDCYNYCNSKCDGLLQDHYDGDKCCCCECEKEPGQEQITTTTYPTQTTVPSPTTTMMLPPICYDSDWNGNIPWPETSALNTQSMTYGFVTHNTPGYSSPIYDECSPSGTSVHEMFCNYAGYFDYEWVTCPYGCETGSVNGHSAGRCKSAPAPTTTTQRSCSTYSAGEGYYGQVTMAQISYNCPSWCALYCSQHYTAGCQAARDDGYCCAVKCYGVPTTTTLQPPCLPFYNQNQCSQTGGGQVAGWYASMSDINYNCYPAATSWCTSHGHTVATFSTDNGVCCCWACSSW